MANDCDISGFDLKRLDIKKLSKSIHDTVEYLLDAGFSLYDAIENYIKGNFSQWLKKLVKPFENKHAEGTWNSLLVRLCLDWIDTKVGSIFPTELKYFSSQPSHTLNPSIFSEFAYILNICCLEMIHFGSN